MALNERLARKVLTTLFHPTTPEDEARNAASVLRGMLARAGTPFPDIDFSLPAAEAQRHATETISALKRQAANWESRLRAVWDLYKPANEERLRLSAECERLKAEKAELAKRVEQLETAAPSDLGVGYVDFQVAAVKAARVFGHSRCKPVWAFAMGMTLKELSGWQAAKAFPAHLLKLLDRLTSAQIQPASRQPWSNAEIERLKAVLATGASDLEAAQILSDRFGRRIFEPSIARQRRRLFRNEGWKPHPKPKSGRAAVPKARPAAARTWRLDLSQNHVKSSKPTAGERRRSSKPTDGARHQAAL